MRKAKIICTLGPASRKQAIQVVNRMGGMVIAATEMLESMNDERPQDLTRR